MTLDQEDKGVKGDQDHSIVDDVEMGSLEIKVSKRGVKEDQEEKVQVFLETRNYRSRVKEILVT